MVRARHTGGPPTAPRHVAQVMQHEPAPRLREPTRVDATPNIAGLVWRTAATDPARPAVIADGHITDYASLQRRASAIAASLTNAGLLPYDRVGIFLDGGADAVAAFFGVTAAGGIAVVINESLRPRQVEHILHGAGASTLITSEDLLARQPRPLETPSRVLPIHEVPSQAGFAPLPRVGMDPAQIVYTSGSTGLPRGVTVTHANLLAAAATVIDYLGIVASDRIASVLPFSFVYGMSQVLCAVGSGAALVMERSPLATQLVANLRAQRITVLAAVPPLWQQLLHVASFCDEPLASLRIATNAGGHLPVPVVRALRRAQPHARLFLMYGLTEVLRSTFLPPEEVDRRPDSIGRAIPGAEVLVVRDDLSACAPGEVGELVHRGPTVALGYWNAPEATARAFRPHPLRPAGSPDTERVVFSGDLVRRDATVAQRQARRRRAARRAEARLMEAIRAFRHEDIPRVAELFSSTFTHNGNSPLPGPDTYLQRVFFESPLHEEDMPSFVYLDARGSIVGFIGVQPRRLCLRGRRIRAAVATKLMVAPAARGSFAAARLLNRAFAGPQDVLFSDLSNDAGRRL